MLIDFLQFLAQLIIALTILRLAQVKLVERNPESPLAEALAFIN